MPTSMPQLTDYVPLIIRFFIHAIWRGRPADKYDILVYQLSLSRGRSDPGLLAGLARLEREKELARHLSLRMFRLPVTRWPDENPNAVFVRFVLHARRAPDGQSGGGSADGGKPPHQRRGNRSSPMWEKERSLGSGIRILSATNRSNCW
ncbi:MAG: hypothetical protein ACP5I8_07250 [Phycisphaerae bacterium]